MQANNIFTQNFYFTHHFSVDEAENYILVKKTLIGMLPACSVRASPFLQTLAGMWKKREAEIHVYSLW